MRCRNLIEALLTNNNIDFQKLLEYYDDIKGYISIRAFDFGLNLFSGSGYSADVCYAD